MRIFAISAVFLLLTSFAVAADFTVEHYDKSFDIQGKGKLYVKNADGIVRLLAEPGSGVNVEVTKQVLHAKDEAQAKQKADDVSVKHAADGFAR